MCNGIKNCNNKSLNDEVFINLQTGKVLNISRVDELNDSALLKVKPELWCEWDFAKNDELGFDIWEMTYGSGKKVNWKCKDCKSNYDASANNRFYNKDCPYCAGQKVNHTNSLATLNPELANQWHPTKNGDLTPHNVTCNKGSKVWWICENGHEWEAVISSRTRGTGCPYCANKKVWIGFNDMWTINPELASLLANLEDGHKYTQMSNKKVDWMCPDCESIIRNKSINSTNKQGLFCSRCGDNMSTPEKIMHSLLLKHCVEEFIFDSKREWSDNKRYDFYIPSLSVIIETHGEQHYNGKFESIGGRNLKEEQENDKYKRELAISNGIKPENYIVIDCRCSNFEYLKKSILNSKLVELFDLTNVDWNSVYEMSMKSMHIRIVELWNLGATVDDISKHLGISKNKLHKVIKEMCNAGLCSHKYEKIYTDRSNKVYQYDLEFNLIAIWDSTKSIVEHLKFQTSAINGCCSGSNKTSYGFIWRYEKDVIGKEGIKWI